MPLARCDRRQKCWFHHEIWFQRQSRYSCVQRWHRHPHPLGSTSQSLRHPLHKQWKSVKKIIFLNGYTCICIAPTQPNWAALGAESCVTRVTVNHTYSSHLTNYLSQLTASQNRKTTHCHCWGSNLQPLAHWLAYLSDRSAKSHSKWK
jgi:hypothetical protein